jgi:hypothetical protein
VAYLDRLEKWIASGLAEKPVGEPVAVRAFFQLTGDHGLLLPTLAAATAIASTWFSSRPSRLYALGGVEAGYASVLAEFAGGQTAMLTVESLQRGRPSVTMLVIGNHGTIRYEDSPESTGSDISGIPWKKPLLEALEQSLRRAAPVLVEGDRA